MVGWAAATTASSLPRSRNLTALPRGSGELLLPDLDQLFLSSDCRHFNRTESLRCGEQGEARAGAPSLPIMQLVFWSPVAPACSASQAC